MAHSERGASRAILNLAYAESVIIIASDAAIAEAKSRIRRNYPNTLAKIEDMEASKIFGIVNASKSEIESASPHVVDPNDAHILAAARKSVVDALVSFDRKHLHTEKVASYVDAPVITPGQALGLIRAFDK